MTNMDDPRAGGAVMEREPNARQAAHSADDEEQREDETDQDSYLAQIREASVPYPVNQVILTRTLANQGK